MTKIKVAKDIATSIVGLSTARVVNQIIRNNVDEVETPADKVVVLAASFAIGGMVADAARDYTDATIDKSVAWYRETFKKTA